MTAANSPVLAAGALCWRMVDGKLRVLLVHRGDRADVSLPKGKVEPGETLPQTAVREIAEETGLAIALEAPLGTVEYQLPNGREKVVYYWAAEVTKGTANRSTFESNGEIAALEWLSLDKARAKLSYPHDVDVLDRFQARVDAGTSRTFAIIALRHGKATPPESWDGPDSTRPLVKRGAEQAASIAAGIAAYRPKKLITSTAVRCISTIAPLASVIGRPVITTPDISQEAFENHEANVAAVVAKRLARQRTTVLCSHGPVIPEIVAEVARLTKTAEEPTLRNAAMLSTGEYTVLHISVENPTAGIVAMETHGPAPAS